MLIKICVPAYKGLMNQKLKNTIEQLMSMDPPDQFIYGAWAHPYPEISRNEAICASNLQYPTLPRVDAVLTIDADMLPEINQILRLVKNYESGEYKVLGAVYRKNSEKHEYCVQVQQGESEKRLYNDILPVYTMGFGCAIIDIQVLKVIPKPWFNTYITTRTVNDIGMWRHVPEDENFCSKVREACGCHVFCDFTTEIKHEVVSVEDLDRRMSL